MRRALLAAAVLLLMAGCGKADGAEENRIVISKEGEVSATYVSPFEDERYDIEELKAQTEASVEAYNTSAGEEKIRVTACRESEGRAVLSISCSSLEDYAAFNGTTLAKGTMREMTSAGTLLGTDFLISADGTLRTTAAEAVEGHPDLNVLTIDEETTVTVPGVIVYYIGDVDVIAQDAARSGDPADEDGVLDAPCYIFYEE